MISLLWRNRPAQKWCAWGRRTAHLTAWAEGIRSNNPIAGMMISSRAALRRADEASAPRKQNHDEQNDCRQSGAPSDPVADQRDCGLARGHAHPADRGPVAGHGKRLAAAAGGDWRRRGS